VHEGAWQGGCFGRVIFYVRANPFCAKSDVVQVVGGDCPAVVCEEKRQERDGGSTDALQYGMPVLRVESDVSWRQCWTWCEKR